MSQLVDAIIAEWKDQPKKIAKKLISQYGAPDEITRERLVWNNKGPWKRSELINEEIPHNFPDPHHDSLLQAIPYQVPPERVSELLRFDGSVIVERTRGELAARCDDERANYLALNLVHEILTNRMNVSQARLFYAETVQQKKHQEYMDGFMFRLPSGDQADPDVEVEARKAATGR